MSIGPMGLFNGYKMEKPLNTFTPAKAFRNRHLQSIGASIKLRRPMIRKRAAAMLRETREVIVQCGNNVRLQGFYSPHTDGPRDLVILLHGWEGSGESMYLLSSGGSCLIRVLICSA